MEGRQVKKGDMLTANFAYLWGLGNRCCNHNLLSAYQLEKARQDEAAALAPTPSARLVRWYCLRRQT